MYGVQTKESLLVQFIHFSTFSLLRRENVFLLLSRALFVTKYETLYFYVVEIFLLTSKQSTVFLHCFPRSWKNIMNCHFRLIQLHITIINTVVIFEKTKIVLIKWSDNDCWSSLTMTFVHSSSVFSVWTNWKFSDLHFRKSADSLIQDE